MSRSIRTVIQEVQRCVLALSAISLGSAAAPVELYGEVFMTREEAVSQMLPDRAGTAFNYDLSEAQIESIESRSGVPVEDKKFAVWKSAVGTFLVIDTVIGKHELITYAVAIDAERKVKNVEILEYLEAYGSEVSEDWWRQQFIGKSLRDSLELTKDITNISGATFSCRHVTEGVKRVLVTLDTVLPAEAV